MKEIRELEDFEYVTERDGTYGISRVKDKTVTSVIIPDCITRICVYAFHGCKDIQRVVIPDSVAEIDNWAFMSSKYLTEVNIPKSVKNFNNHVFEDCTSLTKITIPSSVRSIGACSFRGCTSLKQVTIENGVTGIEQRAFENCTSLTEITIPSSVENIEMYAFKGCVNLEKVIIENGVQVIRKMAFNGCKIKLADIKIPESVKYLGPDEDVDEAGYRKYLEELEKERWSKIKPRVLSKQETLEYLKRERESSYWLYRRSNGRYYKRQFIPSYTYGIPEKYLADREFVAEAVKYVGAVLNNAPEELKNDRELILTAAANCESYFDLKIDSKLFDDRDFVLKLVSVNGTYLHEYGVYDKQIILTAVKQNYLAASYIRPYHLPDGKKLNVLADREFVKEMVALSGRTLKYVIREFKDDEEIVLIASGNNYRALEFASNRLKNDENFLIKVLEVNPSCLAYCPLKMRSDREFVLKLMQVKPYVYRYVKGSLSDDFWLAITALKADAYLYEYISFSLWKQESFRAEVQKLIDGGTLTDEQKECLQLKLKNVNTILNL